MQIKTSLVEKTAQVCWARQWDALSAIDHQTRVIITIIGGHYLKRSFHCHNTEPETGPHLNSPNVFIQTNHFLSRIPPLLLSIMSIPRNISLQQLSPTAAGCASLPAHSSKLCDTWLSRPHLFYSRLLTLLSKVLQLQIYPRHQTLEICLVHTSSKHPQKRKN